MLFSQCNYQEETLNKDLGTLISYITSSNFLTIILQPHHPTHPKRPENVATALILVLASEVERRLVRRMICDSFSNSVTDLLGHNLIVCNPNSQ